MTWQYRELLKEHLQSFFKVEEKELNIQNPVLMKAWEHLQKLSVEGKLLRGSLFLEGFTPFEINDKHYHIAMAIELIHSAFLIHDDIMDKSLERRGSPSLHMALKYDIEKESSFVGDSHHYGVSAAICMGDLAIFLAQKILVQGSYSQTNWSILALLQKEWAGVCLGQMLDLYAGNFSYSEGFSIQEILEIYEKKTAYYTFSIPLVCFATVLEWDKEKRDQLFSLGRDLGVLFQIKDDYGDIFGDFQSMKKVPGQDIKEKKKTLHLCFLYESLEVGERERFKAISDSSTPLSSTELNWIKEKIDTYSILEKVKSYTRPLKEKVKEGLKEFSKTPIHNILENLTKEIIKDI